MKVQRSRHVVNNCKPLPRVDVHKIDHRYEVDYNLIIYSITYDTASAITHTKTHKKDKTFYE